MSNAVFGDFFDTFSTLWAGRFGKTFLRLFEDFGARGFWRLLYMGIAIVTLGSKIIILYTLKAFQH